MNEQQPECGTATVEECLTEKRLELLEAAVTQVQTSIISLNNKIDYVVDLLGKLDGKVATLDKAAHARLSAIEQTVGIDYSNAKAANEDQEAEQPQD